jgi:hypothetical protein
LVLIYRELIFYLRNYEKKSKSTQKKRKKTTKNSQTVGMQVQQQENNIKEMNRNKSNSNHLAQSQNSVVDKVSSTNKKDADFSTQTGSDKSSKDVLVTINDKTDNSISSAKQNNSSVRISVVFDNNNNDFRDTSFATNELDDQLDLDKLNNENLDKISASNVKLYTHGTKPSLASKNSLPKLHSTLSKESTNTNKSVNSLLTPLSMNLSGTSGHGPGNLSAAHHHFNRRESFLYKADIDGDILGKLHQVRSASIAAEQQ